MTEITDWLVENAPEKAKIDTKKFSYDLIGKVLSIKIGIGVGPR